MLPRILWVWSTFFVDAIFKITLWFYFHPAPFRDEVFFVLTYKNQEGCIFLRQLKVHQTKHSYIKDIKIIFRNVFSVPISSNLKVFKISIWILVKRTNTPITTTDNPQQQMIYVNGDKKMLIRLLIKKKFLSRDFSLEFLIFFKNSDFALEFLYLIFRIGLRSM